MQIPEGYRAVIGLEIHAQLLSRAKIYCPDPVDFAGQPNSRVSPISLGHPGTLPSVNRQCVELAVKMGLATGCAIAPACHFARKNYFYPDLPKGYQITQDKTPICIDGHLDVRLKDGRLHHVRIQRIHIEEDAGKSLHDQDLYDTLIDLNRASVGLIEIVSHPDMSNAEEAMAYLTEVRKLVRYLDICDGNMEEGSLRCDANISVMRHDATEFGTRVEVKNMNSISNVGRAINHEILRQIELVEAGGQVGRETRTWDAASGTTMPMRDKESADDYRYFPEPDLQPLRITEDMLHRIQGGMPELPEALYQRLRTQHGLPEFDATVITEDRDFAAFAMNTIALSGNAKAAANWLIGPVRAWLNEQAVNIREFPLSAGTLAALVRLVDDGAVSFSVAKDVLFPEAVAQANGPLSDVDVLALAQARNLLLERDDAATAAAIAQVLDANADKVATYLAGKDGLLGFFVGQVMRALGGKADPKLVNQATRDALERRRTA